MSIYSGTTGDQILDSCLSRIRTAMYGKEARAPIIAAVERCYQVAITRAGGAKNGISSSRISEHTSRIRNAVFGEEVRDALKTVLGLVCLARGINPSSTLNIFFDQLINAQTGEELKNGILTTIVRCRQEVGA